MGSWDGREVGAANAFLRPDDLPPTTDFPVLLCHFTAPSGAGEDILLRYGGGLVSEVLTMNQCIKVSNARNPTMKVRMAVRASRSKV